MRRPDNWVLICLSLLLLLANLSASGRRSPAAGEAIALDFIDTTAPVTEFGYVRADGSFMPLPPEPGDAFTSASPAWR